MRRGHNLIGAEFDLTGLEVISSLDKARRIGQVTMMASAPKPGEVIYKAALLRVAIVDKAGQRP
ncbi:hypothetical protein ACIBSW_32430 [Actinoplanes sp. NPDC049668]|uniref:hypothetical protein n=1 Tax=unclassified Actinoplanes TaxID=2626549 RepID=UPI00339E2415